MAIGVTVLDVKSLEHLKEPVPHFLVISPPAKQFQWKRLKYLLEQIYPGKYPVMVVRNRRKPPWKRKGDFKKWVPLSALEKLSLSKMRRSIHYLCLPPLNNHSVSELMIIMEKLRGEKGCPWDKKQDHKTLKPYVIEEAYEVIEAIDSENPLLLKDELGDLLLQIIFHAHLARESGNFAFSQVVNNTIMKLIRRHPHVFGELNGVNSLNDVRCKWDEIKKMEKQDFASSKNTCAQEDSTLPALIKAIKTQEKAARLGFDWETLEGPLEKLKEEVSELWNAYWFGSRQNIEEELGDLMFTLVNVSRFMGINPEIMLVKTINKFNKRFDYINNKVKQEGKDMSAYDIGQLERWWNESKKEDEN